MGRGPFRRRPDRVQETRLRNALRRGQRVLRKIRLLLHRHPLRAGRTVETPLGLIEAPRHGKPRQSHAGAVLLASSARSAVSSRLARGRNTSPISALHNMNVSCAARLYATIFAGVALVEKNSSHAAWLVPRCATEIGSAAARKTSGKNTISFTNGIAIPYSASA